jgi:hypothetical protein
VKSWQEIEMETFLGDRRKWRQLSIDAYKTDMTLEESGENKCSVTVIL